MYEKRPAGTNRTTIEIDDGDGDGDDDARRDTQQHYYDRQMVVVDLARFKEPFAYVSRLSKRWILTK
jgi:hypothetical protein